MSVYVDPQHIEIIIAKARDEADHGTCCDCSHLDDDEQCLAHLVLALLRPSVTAHEPVF